MQTFLPYRDFKKSAKCLDRLRLGKQRVETLQILKALYISNYGWQNHPAVKMWRGYEHALAEYGVIICLEWISRGYKDTCLNKIRSILPSHLHCLPIGLIKMPPWFGMTKFHQSHQSNLLRKFPEHYSQFNWNVPDNLPYVWPA